MWRALTHFTAAYFEHSMRCALQLLGGEHHEQESVDVALILLRLVTNFKAAPPPPLGAPLPRSHASNCDVCCPPTSPSDAPCE